MRLLAANRTENSHVAGGAALNRAAARLSADIDIFNDPKVSVSAVAQLDAVTLTEAGFEVTWRTQVATFHSADIAWEDETTRLDWAQDSAWRFFPAVPDEQFGFVLHPGDLATNKALAAAARSTARDTVDLVHIDEFILPLGALVCAAVGKDEGFTPEALIQWIARFTPRRAEDFSDVDATAPLDVPSIRRRLHEALAEARDYVAQVPSEHVGCLFLDGGKLIAPEPGSWSKYERRVASPGGVWPTSPEIGSAMLAAPTH